MDRDFIQLTTLWMLEAAGAVVLDVDSVESDSP